MAVPKRRTSKTRRDMRRTHVKLAVPGMVACSHCGELKLSHRVCKECGHYDSKVIIKKDKKKN